MSVQSLRKIGKEPTKRPTLSFDGGSYLVGEPSKAESSRRGKNQVWISIQETLEHFECGNQVGLTSSPLQGMRAQPLSSLFVGEVTNGSYQPRSLSLNLLKMIDICHEVWQTGWHTIFEVWMHLDSV